ncbi:PH domain-containing protein [Haloechinothrix sp. LS1_15]|uniref:PH domain-containing protein n=1 Tax=Haloechinothrix sp. LS1_15 TaxID=2652248 RepID=UPI0029447C57|nr:PH domain-containing protein [Haloechinothrix sp. LS1_15]MDV6012946.1 PH domain-containing protein [Haloechinothrix sp. LS1_15]
MGYPKGVLGTGEQVLVHKHPHLKMLVMPVLVGVVVIGGGIWLVFPARDLEEPWDTVALASIAGLGLLLLCWLVIAPFVRWRTTHFLVTEQRVISREGVIKRTGLDIPMSRINSVRFERTLFDRLLGTGSLIIESASEQALEFDDVPSVVEVYSAINWQAGERGQQQEPDEADIVPEGDTPSRRKRSKWS